MLKQNCSQCSENQSATGEPEDETSRRNEPPGSLLESNKFRKRLLAARNLSRAQANSFHLVNKPSSDIGSLELGLSFQPAATLAQASHLASLTGPLLLNATSGGHAQFTLTPDARACVTATYLCMLIVNNTWLDCNLLDILCNNLNGTNSDRAADHTERDLTIELKELELALDDLIAFTGGGSGSSLAAIENDTSVAGTDNVGTFTTPVSRLHHLVELSRPPEGAFHDEIAKDRPPPLNKPPLYAAQNLSRHDLLRPPEREDEAAAAGQHDQQQDLVELADGERLDEQEPDLAKLNRLVDEDKSRMLEFFLQRRKELGRQQSLQEKSRKFNQTANFQAEETAQSLTTLSPLGLPATTTAPSSSYLTNWMSRPLQLVKGWSPQSLWIWPYSESSGGFTTERPLLASSSLDYRPSSTNQMQLLRPIDRTELYNDIQTNQSSPSSPGVAQKAEHRQPYATGFGGHQFPGQVEQQQQQQHLEKSELGNIVPANHNNKKYLQPQFLPKQPSGGGGGGNDLLSELNLSETYQAPSATTPTSRNLMPFPAIPLGGEFSGFGQQPLSRLNPQHQQALARNQPANFHQSRNQQQFAQQFAYQQQDDDHCKCNDLLLETNLDAAGALCRFRCTSGSSTLVVPTHLLADKPQQMLPAATFGQPTTVASIQATTGSSSSAKMNPMDVTFSLYTRYHRDLAKEMAQFHVGSSSTLAPISLLSSQSVSPPTPQSGSSTPLPSPQNLANQNRNADLATNLIHFGELIELASNGTSLSSEPQHFNGSLPVKIIIHGFGSGGKRPWVSDMVHKFLDFEDVNVIVVDWERGATLPNYVQAAGNTRLVGHKIASLIKSLNGRFGLTGSSYHLIGFSLGAHVAGFAGMELRAGNSSSSCLINRITGLDPASPLFEGYEASDRLDLTDAKFVDVVHSNGDGVLRGGFGSLQPMGHVDFYPNGGRVQVGCNSVILSALSDIIYGKWQSLCNHRRALNFFMDSFEFDKCRFRSFNCDSYEAYLRGECFDCGPNNEKCSYMGYLSNYSKGRGKMYLTTHEEAPFCANQFIIKIIGSRGFRQNQWGKVEVTLMTSDGRNESFWLSSLNQQTTHHEMMNFSSSGGPSTILGAGGLERAIQFVGSGGTGGGGGVNGGSGGVGNANGLAGGSGSIPASAAGAKANGESLIVSQHSMQSLIVARPSLTNFTQVLLRYTKYKGWIYSGDESWSIDKVYITDSEGQVKSFCGFNTILESHITSRLSLEQGNCTVGAEQAGNQQQQQQQVLLSSSQLAAEQRGPQQQEARQAPQRTGRLFGALANGIGNNNNNNENAPKGHLGFLSGGNRMTTLQGPPGEQIRQQQQHQLSVPFPFNNYNQIPFLAF